MRPEAAHFGTEEAARDASHLGMWVFIATEVLLFAALFVAYGVYRSVYGDLFHEAQRHMSVGLGTLNTYVLVTSSILVALAVHRGREGRAAACGALLWGAVLLGVLFLVLKGVEYGKHVREGALPGAWYAFEGFARPGASLFYSLYWLITGLHAVHVSVGLGVLGTLAVRAGRFSAAYSTPLELGGMYWHLVDVVWLFVYPLMYLS
ncbi:cytochrome c oxidase subunit 3 [Myxococcaceae bacterium GXIMD 01537]